MQIKSLIRVYLAIIPIINIYPALALAPGGGSSTVAIDPISNPTEAWTYNLTGWAKCVAPDTSIHLNIPIITMSPDGTCQLNSYDADQGGAWGAECVCQTGGTRTISVTFFCRNAISHMAYNETTEINVTCNDPVN